VSVFAGPQNNTDVRHTSARTTVRQRRSVGSASNKIYNGGLSRDTTACIDWHQHRTCGLACRGARVSPEADNPVQVFRGYTWGRRIAAAPQKSGIVAQRHGTGNRRGTPAHVKNRLPETLFVSSMPTPSPWWPTARPDPKSATCRGPSYRQCRPGAPRLSPPAPR
jgi:hypothetical protein